MRNRFDGEIKLLKIFTDESSARNINMPCELLRQEIASNVGKFKSKTASCFFVYYRHSRWEQLAGIATQVH